MTGPSDQRITFEKRTVHHDGLGDDPGLLRASVRRAIDGVIQAAAEPVEIYESQTWLIHAPDNDDWFELTLRHIDGPA